MSAVMADDDRQIAAFRDGLLDDAATSAFERRLVSEPALARRLAAHVLLDLDLHARARQSHAPTIAATSTGASSRTASSGTASSAIRRVTTSRIAKTKRAARRTRPFVWWPVAAAAAAVLVAVIALGWPGASAPVEVQSSPGTTVSIDGRSWSGTATGLRIGQRLRVSAPVTLRWRSEATEVVLLPTVGEAAARLLSDGLELEAGAVEAQVATRGPDRRFRITAGAAQATVLGTRFRVERQGARTLLAVTSGRVELRQGDAARVVGAGSSAIADASGVTESSGVVKTQAATLGVELERGLFARWSGDGLDGTRLRDLGPGGHHGEAKGLQAIAGRQGKALHVDGERSLVTIPHSDAFDPGDPTKPFSVALWLRTPVGANHEQNLIAKGRTTAQPGPTIALCLVMSGGERIDVYRWHDGPALGAPQIESSGWRVGPLADNAWHHLAVVCENAALRRCYHNGIEVGTDTTLWRNDTRNRTRWTLGRLENMGFTKEDPLTGDLEDVRVYDRVLTAAEVTALAAPGR